MSLDKAIEHGKEKRKEYRGSKAIDKSCRNHGGCPWCERNRKFKEVITDVWMIKMFPKSQHQQPIKETNKPEKVAEKTLQTVSSAALYM